MYPKDLFAATEAQRLEVTTPDEKEESGSSSVETAGWKMTPLE